MGFEVTKLHRESVRWAEGEEVIVERVGEDGRRDARGGRGWERVRVRGERGRVEEVGVKGVGGSCVRVGERCGRDMSGADTHSGLIALGVIMYSGVLRCTQVYSGVLRCTQVYSGVLRSDLNTSPGDGDWLAGIEAACLERAGQRRDEIG